MGAFRLRASVPAVRHVGVRLGALWLVVAFSLVCASSAAALPLAPTGRTADHGLRVRPHVIGVTGDGTGFLGGFTTRRSARRPSHLNPWWAGRIRWTRWTRSGARGHGAIWIDNGIPSDALGTFHPWMMRVRLWRSRHGVFTRMRLQYRYHGGTRVEWLHAIHSPASRFSPGFWLWWQ